jgi:NADP-reducing hydrogenase subunit HndB
MSARIQNPEDLKKLRDQVRSEVDLRGGPKEIRITVHLGTCGIAAGARDVLAELSAELARTAVENVTLRQSGCIGLCDQEPMLTYADKGGTEYLYVRLDRKKAQEIVRSHVLRDQPVNAYLASR